MNARAAIVLTVSSLALIPFGALAQSTIPYEVGQYEFAQPLPELDDDEHCKALASKKDEHAAELLKLKA